MIFELLASIIIAASTPMIHISSITDYMEEGSNSSLNYYWARVLLFFDDHLSVTEHLSLSFLPLPWAFLRRKCSKFSIISFLARCLIFEFLWSPPQTRLFCQTAFPSPSSLLASLLSLRLAIFLSSLALLSRSQVEISLPNWESPPGRNWRCKFDLKLALKSGDSVTEVTSYCAKISFRHKRAAMTMRAW